MRIGNSVTKKNSKTTTGIILSRAPIYNCWEVRWTSGNRRGSHAIVHESELVLAKKSSS
jgi:hypothetical protein